MDDIFVVCGPACSGLTQTVHPYISKTVFYRNNFVFDESPMTGEKIKS